MRHYAVSSFWSSDVSLPQGNLKNYRGRELGCPSPPAQIWTCALTHPAPTSGVDDKPLARPQVTDGGFRPMEAYKAVQCWPTVAIFLRASAQSAHQHSLDRLNEFCKGA